MKMKTCKQKHPLSLGRLTFLLICLLHLLYGLSSAQQVLDRIVAVVGDQIILESELDMQLQIYANQTGIELQSPTQTSQLKKELLDQLINDKLLLLAAKKDTTIQVTPREVEEAVKEQLKKVKSEFSEEAFKEQLKSEGLTESELRKKYREQIKNQMMIDRLIASKLSKVSVSTREVKDFYQTYKDSIPDQPNAIKLSHILLEIKTSQETLDSLRSVGENIVEMAKKGKDFAQLASLYSDDPTGKEGGDLGFFKKGDMIPKFEQTAFALKPGEISDVVETELGFHVIKVEGKRDDQVHARHILLLVAPNKKDTLQAEQFADSLYHLLLEGADFTEMAKQFSVDEESRKIGGELGWYPVDQMTPEFKEGVRDLNVEQVSPPLKSQFGVHILKILDKREQRKVTLEDDWDAIKDMVRRKKTNELVTTWVEKLRQDTYVEMRL